MLWLVVVSQHQRHDLNLLVLALVLMGLLVDERTELTLALFEYAAFCAFPEVHPCLFF